MIKSTIMGFIRTSSGPSNGIKHVGAFKRHPSRRKEKVLPLAVTRCENCAAHSASHKGKYKRLQPGGSCAAPKIHFNPYDTFASFQTLAIFCVVLTRTLARTQKDAKRDVGCAPIACLSSTSRARTANMGNDPLVQVLSYL